MSFARIRPGFLVFAGAHAGAAQLAFALRLLTSALVLRPLAFMDKVILQRP
jgi:hypothetical protein